MKLSRHKEVLLHLIPDEKITEDIIELYSGVHPYNLFIIYCEKDVSERNNRQNVLYVRDFDINEYLEGVKAVVVHGLQYRFAKEILSLPLELPVAWLVWGFDVYNLPRIKKSLYGPATLKILKSTNRAFNLQLAIKENDFLRKVIFQFLLRKPDQESVIMKAHQRINYFCTYIEEDFHVFNNYYDNNCTFHYATFLNLDQYLAGNVVANEGPSGNNILVGNSAYPENNHFEVLSYLKGEDLPGLVYVPLSYGKDRKYLKKLKLAGEISLGQKFVPLIDFMDRSKYVELLQSCSCGIFYHFRQQAMGNIIAMLYLGCRIYLSKRNPVYSYLKRIGIIVFNLEEEFTQFGAARLGIVEIEQNRKVLTINFQRSVVETNTRNLVNTLLHAK